MCEKKRRRKICQILHSPASIHFFCSDFSPPFLLSSSLLDASTIIRALGKYTGETTSSCARFCPVKIQMRPRGILRWIEINVAQLIIGRVIIVSSRWASLSFSFRESRRCTILSFYHAGGGGRGRRGTNDLERQLWFDRVVILIEYD